MPDKNPIIGDINRTFPEYVFSNADDHLGEKGDGYLDIIMHSPITGELKAIRFKGVNLDSIGIKEFPKA